MLAKNPEIVVHFCEQGAPEWYEARLGKVTASNFSKVMAGGEGKVRSKLLRDLAAEILTGEPAEGFQSWQMQRGKDMEADARDWYDRNHLDIDVQQIGFMFNPEINAGWSPDGLCGDDGGLELKWHEPHVMISLLEKGTFPPEHRAQCHGALWVSGRQWIDYVAYSHAKLPKYYHRVQRDETYIDEIAAAVRKFNIELEQLVARMRKLMV
ncbi:MAG: YqaJ viral recombinase family protein [Patescibacteria group bacterium]|nr:YqaJ viral recombinase family protein [Patescibacteria group bacterium]